jgi:hypothetical protein
MNTFLFDTGVRPERVHNPPFSLGKGQVIKNGTMQIPFDCTAPVGSTIMFLCDNPDIPEGKVKNVVVVPIYNTTMLSKYAYLRTKGGE